MAENSGKRTALVAFGANLGDGVATFETVKRRLKAEFGGKSEAKSNAVQVATLIRTVAVTLPGSAPEPDYWNSAFRVELSADWTPERFLRWLLALETELGRVRKPGAGAEEHWKARMVDLDLLLWDELFLDATPTLIVPHPLLPWRRFVLEPACEIASDWVHPLMGVTLGELLERLNSPKKNDDEKTIIWDSEEPVPAELISSARATKMPILARRWICRNGEPREIFDTLASSFRKSDAENQNGAGEKSSKTK